LLRNFPAGQRADRNEDPRKYALPFQLGNQACACCHLADGNRVQPYGLPGRLPEGGGQPAEALMQPLPVLAVFRNPESEVKQKQRKGQILATPVEEEQDRVSQ